MQVDKSNREEALAAIRDAGADIAFVMGWSQICGPAFRALFPDRAIGYHPAALPRLRGRAAIPWTILRSEEHTSELQSLMRISYAVFCLKKKKNIQRIEQKTTETATM